MEEKKSLDIPSWNEANSIQSSDQVVSAIEKFFSHPSINIIKEKCPKIDIFEFMKVTEEDIVREIMRLDSSKKCSGSIPVKILKFSAT